MHNVLLLAAGCSPSIKSSHTTSRYFGQGLWNRETPYQYLTPLRWAAHEKNKEIVQILLDAKAEIQATTQNGYTPLHSAVFPPENSKKKAMQERLPVTQLLLVHGADAKGKDKYGHTPLHLVTYPSESCTGVDLEEAFGVAKILIQYGADLDELNNQGITPRQRACNAYMDVRIRSLEAFEFRNPRAKAVNGLHTTTTAYGQPSENVCGTKAVEDDSFLERVIAHKANLSRRPTLELEVRTQNSIL